MPRSFLPRYIPCTVPGCNQLFTKRSGLTNHVRHHEREERMRNMRSAPRRVNSNQSGSPNQLRSPPSSPEYIPPESGHGSQPPGYIPSESGHGSQPDNLRGLGNLAEDIYTHPYLSGRPCDKHGNFLPDGAPPSPWDDPAPDNYGSFENRASFELADLLFRRTQMPATDINDLLQIWASTLDDNNPPFNNSNDLNCAIDNSCFGDIPWQSFIVSYNGDIKDDAPWRRASYDIWFRDPREVLKEQLSNRDFHGEIDFSPKKVHDCTTGKRRYQDLMSGDWAWRQADMLAEDEQNHGATFCPIILGSDKTTVSVATGQNEYYPLYMSNGLIHNNVRRAHRNGVSLIGFLAIPKTDREHDDSEEFRRFRRHILHASIAEIMKTLRLGMTKPEVLRFGDGHYRRVIFGLGPYIADYPEQVQLSCIVQNWCPKCTADKVDLDGNRGRRTHEHTRAAMNALDTKTLWNDYGIVDGIMPFTASFPRANIHELITPDLLHQVIKGTFKDHLVTWIEQYIESVNTGPNAKRILAELDRRIRAVPLYPSLRRFPEGRGFKQWTGNDSRALMKVYLPAVSGLVPSRMVQAIRYFMEFCYIARRCVLDENDLQELNHALANFHEARKVFVDEGVRPDGFCLPRQHSLTHYYDMIKEFGAPNGLCSSITESRHIKAVKEPWRRSSRFNALSQMLLTNQRLDKLAAARVNFQARGMLKDSLFGRPIDLPPEFVVQPAEPDEDDDGGEVESNDILGKVFLAKEPVRKVPRKLLPLSVYLNLPKLPDAVSRFLYQIDNPGYQLPLANVPLDQCPRYTGKIFTYPSATALYFAPSDICGTNGMHRERIRSVPSWRDGPERRDCVLVEHDASLPGFRGLFVAQVLGFFKIMHKRVTYRCAFVTWFSTLGDEPCPDTGMWRVVPDFDADGQRSTSLIHIDTIFRGIHLIGIAGSHNLPKDIDYSDSLSAFKSFYVNKYIDYHAHETLF